MKAELGLLVGEAVAGKNDGAGEPGGTDPSIGSDPDEGGICQALFARPEGA